MANITLSLPDEVSKEMKEFSEVRWSQVARRAIIEKLETLKLAESISSKSKLTEKDVEEISMLIKKSVAKKFFDEVHRRH